MTLELQDLYRSFPGGVVALQGVSLSFPLRGYACVMGASGCGKTTLLRVVAGLEAPDRGEVVLAGQRITHLPAERRPVHTLFQGYALFPHLSAWDNVAFAPRLAGLRGAALDGQVAALLADVGLPVGLHTRRPAELSGGERQRVALARALARSGGWAYRTAGGPWASTAPPSMSTRWSASASASSGSWVTCKKPISRRRWVALSS